MACVLLLDCYWVLISAVCICVSFHIDTLLCHCPTFLKAIVSLIQAIHLFPLTNRLQESDRRAECKAQLWQIWDTGCSSEIVLLGHGQTQLLVLKNLT